MTTVSDVMTKNVLAVNQDANIVDAAQRMHIGDCGCLVVMEGPKAVGIVTERDLVRRVLSTNSDPTKVRVGEVMSKPLISVPQSLHIEEAAKIMSHHKVRRLLVVEAGMVVGIVTSSDLASYLAAASRPGDPLLSAIARKPVPTPGPYG